MTFELEDDDKDALDDGKSAPADKLEPEKTPAREDEPDADADEGVDDESPESADADGERPAAPESDKDLEGRVQRAVLKAFDSLLQQGSVRQPEEGRTANPATAAWDKIAQAAASGEPYAVTAMATLQELRARDQVQALERELTRVPRKYRAATRSLIEKGDTRSVRLAYEAVLGRESRKTRGDIRDQRERLDELEGSRRTGKTSVSARPVAVEEDKERTLKASKMGEKLKTMSEAQQTKFMHDLDSGKIRVVPD